MRILGMKLWPGQLTDAEYVERIRKHLKVSRSTRYAAGIVGMLVFAGAIWLINMAWNALAGTVAPQQQSLIILVMAAAVIFGLTIGIQLANVAEFVKSIYFEPRKDRLLVDCWDALHGDLDEMGEGRT